MVQYINKLVRDAYHGTSRTNAQSIIQSGRFNPSRGSHCYLGDGVYFFEGSVKYAQWWAERQYARRRIGIIIAEVQLGRCLDLTNPQYIALLKYATYKIENAQFREKITDAFVINFIATKVDRNIETVKGYFPGSKGKTVFPESRILEVVKVMICVRKPDNISNAKLLGGV